MTSLRARSEALWRGQWLATRDWRWLAAAGFGARLLIALLSIGSNDVHIWHQHAEMVLANGLRFTYVHNPIFNHPPLMGLWAALSLRLAGDSIYLFSLLIKVPGLCGEALTGWLLYRIWLERCGERAAAMALCTYALCLASIMESAFHGNTDALVAALSLAAIYVLDKTKSYFLCGAVLAAALNVKLFPLFLIPLVAWQAPRWRNLFAFAAGGALTLVPYAPFLMDQAPLLYQRMVAYNSSSDNWGITAALRAFSFAAGAENHYQPVGRYLILAAVFAWGAFARWRGETHLYRIASLAYVIFLVLTPGFGVQYLVIPAPLLFAADWRRGALYGALAGWFLVALYGRFGVGRFPLEASLHGLFPAAEACVGFVVWLDLVAVTAITLREANQARASADSQSPPIASSRF